MPDLNDALGLPVVLGLGGLLIAWYLAGNELMRRRAHTLAVWSRRVVDPLGGTQSIRWLGTQAFRLEVEGTRTPFRGFTITGLVEAWDVPFTWAWNRLQGRRDLVVLQGTLRQQPVWGLEVFRTPSVLATDARHFARQEGWQETPFGDLRLATTGEPASQLATDLVSILGDERRRLVRLAVRRYPPHLVVGLHVPDPVTLEPSSLRDLLERMAERAGKA
jgi:hypothetical protein